MPLGKKLLPFVFSGLLLVMAPLFFHNLGKMPLFLWDEARVAVNAAWILRTNDWLVMRADGEPENLGPNPLGVWNSHLAGESSWKIARPVAPPDLWNTKPPLMPWLQALSLYILGPTEAAVRLPAALSGWLTSCFLAYFGWRVLKRPWVGILAGFVLATIPLFNGGHVTRSGDYDAPLALFVTVYVLSFWAYLHTQRFHYLWCSVTGLALALLTKCSAACLPLPALCFYVLWAHRSVLLEKRVWLGLGLAFVPLLLFYALREHASPGYLAASWYNDWVGRFNHPLTPQVNPWWSYPHGLFYVHLSLWTPVLLGCVAIVPSRLLPRYLWFLCWQIVGVLTMLMLAETRTPVYAAPTLPLIALLIAELLWALRAYGTSYLPQFSRIWSAGLVVFIGVESVLLWRFHDQRAQALQANSYSAYGNALRQLKQAELPNAKVLLVREEFNSVLDFHLLMLPATYPFTVEIRPATATAFQKLRTGQQVLGCWPEQREQLRALFDLQTIASLNGPCWCVRLGQRIQFK